jgi:hypothetical protein
MATLTSPQYPFDPTGQATTNKVIGELQPLMGGGDENFIFLIPAAAPFFGDSMTMNFKSLQGDIRPLDLGKDYYFSHNYIGASRACGKPVFGSITMLNNELRGTVIFNPYQTIGGEWTVDAATTLRILADKAHNPRVTSWDQVAGYPNIFPPIPHEWNLRDMVGMTKVVEAINRVVEALLARASSDMTQHIHATGNVHQLTAGDIGAATLEQLDMAIDAALANLKSTTDDFAEGEINKYFTEARVLATRLAKYTVTEPSNINEDDSILMAFMKLQALCSSMDAKLKTKVNMQRPQFVGLGSQNLLKIPMTGTMAIDISLAGAFQLAVSGSGAIGFDTRNVGDMANQVVEFSVSTINDNTGNVYALAWPSNVKWVDGVAPPRTTSAGAKDDWYFYSEDNMVTWSASLSHKNPR